MCGLCRVSLETYTIMDKPNMASSKTIYTQIALLFVLGLLFLGATFYSKTLAAPEFPHPMEQPEAMVAEAPLCRYGVSSWTANDNPYIEDMRAGWVLDFLINTNRILPPGVEYTPVIRLKQERDPVTGARLPAYKVITQPLTDSPGGLGPIIAANPGTLWLIGNEVDRVFWQDDLEPAIYAKAYHEIYSFIKDRDPLARIAISGLVQVTPGRLQYLDLVWSAYLNSYGSPMPVDVWNMHVYILPERREYRPGDDPNAPYYDSRAAVAVGTDPNLAIWESDGTSSQCSRADVYCYAEHDSIPIFIEQITAMRQWMKAKGQQNKPLILSEFSLLYPYIPEGGGCFLQDEYGNCFTPQRVLAFMNNSLDYLENATDVNLGYPHDNYRLVQQWLWYTMHDPFTPGTVNNLVAVDAQGNYTSLSLNGVQYKNRIAANIPYTNPIISGVNNPVAHTITPTGSVSVTLTAAVRNNGNTTANSPLTVTFYADAAKTQMIGTAVISEPIYGCAMEEVRASVTWANLTSGTYPYWVTAGNSTATGVVLINPRSTFLPLVVRH